MILFIAVLILVWGVLKYILNIIFIRKGELVLGRIVSVRTAIKNETFKYQAKIAIVDDYGYTTYKYSPWMIEEPTIDDEVPYYMIDLFDGFCVFKEDGNLIALPISMAVLGLFLMILHYMVFN